MTLHAQLAGVPADQITPEVAAALARIQDENALLRAALAEAQARLGEQEAAADRDPLTGLSNARRFGADVDRTVAQVSRHGTTAALLLVDVTDLPGIAAQYGQVAADAALIHVARLLQKLIRTGDLAARLEDGGFGVILDHLDADSACDTAERIARCIAAEPLDLGGSRLRVDVQIGVATILAGDEPQEVLSRARRSAARAREF